MESKSENPTNLIQNPNINPIIRACFEINHLKNLYRQGWLKRGVPKERCESVAEHSFAVAVLSLWIAEAYYAELDINKILCMALVHDMGEIYAGDITPGDGILDEEKYRLEYKSVAKVFDRLPNGDKYLQLWQEFERGESPEARLVRQVDRLEMGFQASVYQRQGFKDMDEFYASAKSEISDSQLLDLLAVGF